MKIALLNVKTILGHHVIDLIETIHAEDASLSIADMDLTFVVPRQQVGAKVTFNNKEHMAIALEGFIADIEESNAQFDIIVSCLSTPQFAKWSDVLSKHTSRLLDTSVQSLKDVGARYTINNNDKPGITAIPMGASLAVASMVDTLKDIAHVSDIKGSVLYPMAHYGKQAMDELFEQSKLSYIHQDVQPKFFKKKIAFNVLPYHEDIMSDGMSIQEWQLKAEIGRLTKDFKAKPSVNLSVMTVPIFNGTILDLKLTFDKEVTAADIREALKENEDNFLVIDDRRFETMPAALEVASARQAVVTRVREDFASDTGVNLMIMLDPVAYRGAWLERTLKGIFS